MPPTESSPPAIRVATYNVHGCVGMDRRRSEARIAEVISELSVDLIGLQELDFGRLRSAGVDQAGAIAQQLGWKHFFHPAMRVLEEQYGNAILSRHPLVLKRTVELPGLSPWYCREKRVALWAEAETQLGHVQIITTHLGLGGRERMLQSQHLIGSEWLGAAAPEMPLILAGDLNSIWRSRAYRIIAAQLRDVRTLVSSPGTNRTYPTIYPAVAVDHIFVNTHLRATTLNVHRSPLARMASDHYPLVAELTLASP